MSGYAKAIVAALLAGLTALGTAATDNTITVAEWIGVAIAILATSGTVWAVPNRTDSVGQALDESVSLDPDA